MTKLTITEAHTKIESEGKEKNCQDIRFVHRMEIGQVIRQGDIYLHRVPDTHPRGEKIADGTVQLALGQSIGQRHFLVGKLTAFTGHALPKGCARGTFLGPLVVVEDRCEGTHPEHAHYSVPAGTYQVTHQTDERTRQRVQD